MRSYFADTFQPAFPLRAALQPHPPSAPDFVYVQLDRSDNNSDDGETFLLLNVEPQSGVMSDVLDRLPHARIRCMVIATPFTERFSAAPCSTVGTDCSSAVSALCHGRLATRHS